MNLDAEAIALSQIQYLVSSNITTSLSSALQFFPQKCRFHIYRAVLNAFLIVCWPLSAFGDNKDCGLPCKGLMTVIDARNAVTVVGKVGIVRNGATTNRQQV